RCALERARRRRSRHQRAQREARRVRHRLVRRGDGGRALRLQLRSVSADRFGTVPALGLIAFAYVGGITMVSGALFAGLISAEALVPHALDKWLGISGNWTLLFGGVALIVTLIQDPEGVAGSIHDRRRSRRPRRAERAGEGAGRVAAVAPRRAKTP